MHYGYVPILKELHDMTDNFYEDDEPVEEVVAAFERGQQDVTRPPTIRNRQACVVDNNRVQDRGNLMVADATIRFPRS